MRTAKHLEPTERRYYLPELTKCVRCGTPLVPTRHLAWRKTIQTMNTVLFAASHPSYCPEPSCTPSGQLYRSDAAERLSMPGGSYGLDVIVEVGRLRTDSRMTRAEIHTELARRVQISERQVQNLLEDFLALLACASRLDRQRLAEAVRSYGGLIMSVDGLRPENGQPQLWLAREVLTGQPLRAALLTHADSPSLQTFLRPIREAGWPLLATLSDKQSSLVDAISVLWPGKPHQFCQAHYLSDAAQPLYERDRHLAVQIRKTLRTNAQVTQASSVQLPPLEPYSEAISLLIPPPVPAERPVSPSRPPTQSLAPPPALPTDLPLGRQTCNADARCAPTPDKLVAHYTRLIARTLTLRGRAPFRFAGLRLYDHLRTIRQGIRASLRLRADEGLAELETLLQQVDRTFQLEVQHIQLGYGWLTDIAGLLDAPLPTLRHPQPTGQRIARRLQTYLQRLQRQRDLPADLLAFRDHLVALTQRFTPGLYHCYNIPGLPRTNNELESLFRRLKSLERRIVGRQQVNDALLRYGPWLVIIPSRSRSALLEQFRQVQPADFRAESERLRRNQAAFQEAYRSDHELKPFLKQLAVAWKALPEPASS